MNPFLLALLLFPSWDLNASYFQSPVNEIKIKNLSVKTEQRSDVGISELVKGTKPLILVPAYFSCNSTCPLLAENLRETLDTADLVNQPDVLFLSFDTTDDEDSMNMFRKHHRLPSGWRLAVAKSESDAKDLLNQFGYQFQKTADGFDHPNSAFVFSKVKRLWTGILVGVDSTPKDLQKAILEANSADLTGPTHKLLQYISKPEYLIVIGFFGTVLPLLVIIYLLFRRTRKLHEVKP